MCDGSVLTVKNINSPYYYSVGGRVGFGENSVAAVERETYEETGIRFKAGKLAFVHENFFDADFLDDTPTHEISFYYMMEPPPGPLVFRCDSRRMDGGEESLRWLPLDKLDEYEVYPEFYKTDLRDAFKGVRHYITEKGVTRLVL